MKRWLALGGLWFVLAAVPSLSAQDSKTDWATFRGPNRDDHSPDTGLLKEWPKDGPPLAWEKPATGLGSGYSGVSVVGDKIYTMGDIDDSCYLIAVERATGKKLWQAKVGGKGAPGGYPGPRCTPTVSGDLVFALGQNGNLVCVNTKGEEQWQKDMRKDFKGNGGGWGYTESPLVDGDRLICTPGGKDATMIALDKKTGNPIWKGTVPQNGDNAAYSSIVIAEIGKVKQYVTLLANGVVGFKADDGKFLWRYGQELCLARDKNSTKPRFGGNTANIPTCIVIKDQIFCCAGYGTGGALVTIKPTADGNFEAEEVYFNKELNNKHGGIVLVGDYLYGSRDSSPKPYCAELKTGKIVDGWDAKKIKTDGRESVSVTYADGHLYYRYQNGIVALVEAKPDGYAEISSFKIPEGSGPSWPHPTVIGGKLYLRDQDKLWCYDVKAK